MEKKIYLIITIRIKSIQSECIMATSNLTSVVGGTSDEVFTDGYADSKKSVYKLTRRMISSTI